MAIRIFDAAVVGGGPGGSVASLVLARAGCRVLLTEAGGRPAFKVGETLPPACRPLLSDLGLWSCVAAGEHHPCPGNIVSWGGPDLASHDFIRDPNGCGWHLDRPRFDADLRAVVREAGAEVWESCRVHRWSFDSAANGWTIQLAKGGAESTVYARWLIDGTGRRAAIAASCGAFTQVADQMVAYAVLLPAPATDADQRTWIEAAPDGWFYSALLPRRRRLIAFFTDIDLWPSDAWRTGDDMLQRIAQTTHFRQFIGDKNQSTRLYRFPAYTATHAAFAGPGWLAVGDATLAFDPLSSQGIFHAIYTGLRGAEAILASDNGDTNAIMAYEQRIRAIEAAYLSHRLSLYRAENRWQANAFWQRRQLAVNLVPI